MVGHINMLNNVKPIINVFNKSVYEKLDTTNLMGESRHMYRRTLWGTTWKNKVRR
jgi:hypothetical protein